MTDLTNPRYPEKTLTEHDIDTIRQVFKEHHTCFLNDEGRQIVRDMVTGGKVAKKAIIFIIVAVILLGVLSDAVLKKVSQIAGVFK